MSFLYVGHTHEDIDAAFAQVSETLRTNDAETLPKFLHIIDGSRRLQGLFDIKAWLIPHLNDIQHHSEPLHFKFNTDSANDVCVWYRGNSTRPWIRLENTLLMDVPKGQPEILLPSQLHKLDMKALQICVDKSRYSMSGGEGQYRWWQMFLADLANINESYERKVEYARNEARWTLPNLRNKAHLHAKAPTEPVSQYLQSLMDKELDDPNVSLMSTHYHTLK